MNSSTSPVAYIGIGNTDGKLSQARWGTFSSFVRAAVSAAGREPGGEVLGEWYSLPNAGFQNACFALRLPTDPATVDKLKDDLRELGRFFDQDSVAWACAPVTEFLSRAGTADQIPETVLQQFRFRDSGFDPVRLRTVEDDGPAA